MQLMPLSDGIIMFNPEQVANPTSELFAPGYWQQQNSITGTSKGRGITYFVRHNRQHWVLRHYRRGGMMAKVSEDTYLYTGLKRTRPYAEMKLLNYMKQKGLPVPTPVAARVQKQLLGYRGDILIQQIPNAQDAHHCLQHGAISQALWRKIGQMIAQLHHYKVYHHDLNIHNILIDDQEQTWLIDFDKCYVKQENTGWQQDNLARLKRSLSKEQGREPNYHWQETDWQHLITGYQSAG